MLRYSRRGLAHADAEAAEPSGRRSVPSPPSPTDAMQLHTIWFVIIAVLWVGFFVLEGFDFGVGALHSCRSASTETERRVAINTIGPWWDGNEVWLIVAGAAMFAAFPGWYATMFSALYLALRAAAGGAVRARSLVRVPRKARQRAVAQRMDVGADGRQRR